MSARPINSPAPPFVRDRLTWLAYSMLAYGSFTQSMLGPLMPFLRGELNLNYTQGGMLPAAIASGLIFSGLSGDWLARRWGRGRVFWGGAVLLAGAAGILGLSRTFELVFLAALFTGFASSLTQVMIQALLADQHGERRAIAFSESNVAASLSVTLVPLLVGGLQRSGIGWRAAPVLPLVFLIALRSLFFRQVIPDRPAEQAASPAAANGGMSRLFWLNWGVLILVVAVEMTLAFWATDFLFSVVGLSRASAALAYSAFPAAMLVGRITGSRLARRWSSEALLLACLLLTLLGFPIFWLSHSAALNISGLALAGLGIANLYPLSLSVVLGLAPGRSNLASARASLGVGSALFAAPLFLGWLADQLGLQKAIGIGLAFVLAALAIVISQRLSAGRRQEAA